MKSLLLLLALAVPSFAQEAEQVFPLPLFRDGLYTRYSANAIPDGALADALNVLIDEDVDGVVVARNGYAKYNSSPITDEKTVRGLWPFDASDGTKYIVAFSSETFYKTTGDGVWTAIVGLDNFSLTKDFDCVQTLGSFYCANGDTVFSWNGTSTATISGAPLGNIVGRFRNRLLMAGIAGSKARLRGSGELDTSDWTLQVPGVSTTPFSIPFGGVDDGEEITCLMGAFQDVFIVGKRNSLWGLYGFGRTDFQVRELSREVGCLEPRSVREKNNCLYWMSLRGIEKFCGASIERIGDPIRDKIDTIIATAGNARSALDTTQSDFQQGNLEVEPLSPTSATILFNAVTASSFSATDDDASDWAGGVFSSAAVINGSVQISTGAPFLNAGFENGPQATSTDNWTLNGFVIRSFGSLSDRSYSLCSGSCDFSDPNSIVGNSSTIMPARLEVYESGGGILFSSTTANVRDEILFLLGSSGQHVNTSTNAATQIYIKAYAVDYPTFTIQSSTFPNWGNGFNYSWAANCQLGGGNLCVMLFDIKEREDGVGFASGTFVSRVFDTAYSTPIFSTASSTYTAAVLGSTVTFEVASSTDGISFDPFTTSLTNGKRYAKYRAIFEQEISTQVASISTVTLSATTTGYFISQCRNTTNVSSWGLLSCNTTATGGGSITLAVATGTSCNMATRSTATWTTVPNNTTISVATASFVAYRAFFNFDDFGQSASNQLSLLDCTISWQEGETRPPVATQVYRDRYYLAYTSSTASGASNDHLLVLDKNDKWTLFDNHPCYSLAFYNRKLYCGSSTSAGLVWLLDQGTDDDGAAILSRIRSKAFNFGMPERRKEYRRLYLDLEPSPDPSQTITLTTRYTLERSTPTYSLGNIDLNEDPGSIMTPRVPFSKGNPTSGRYLQLELESSGLNSPWRLFGGRLYFSPLDLE